jgi:citrate lyase subunit beta/citryl-CoA lyase
VDLINEHFSPTEDELAYARRVVTAFEEALQRGDASVAVGGQLVDLPIVRRAEALLALADRLVKDREGAAQAADTESEVD